MPFHGDLADGDLHRPGVKASADPSASNDNPNFLWLDDANTGAATGGSFTYRLRNDADDGWLGLHTDSIVAGTFGSARIAANAIGTSELDLSITPTWTGQHQWNDNQAAAFGTGGDATILYTGTTLKINSQQVGTGGLAINENGGTVGIGGQPGANVLRVYTKVGGGGVALRDSTNSFNVFVMGHDGSDNGRILIRDAAGAIKNQIFSAGISYFTGGDVGIGTTTPPTAGGGSVLTFGDNAGDPTMDTNTAGVYAKDVTGTVEVFAIDEADNATQLSPHDPETGEWVFYSRNLRTGRVLKIEMEHMMKRLADEMGWHDLIYEN